MDWWRDAVDKNVYGLMKRWHCWESMFIDGGMQLLKTNLDSCTDVVDKIKRGLMEICNCEK